MAMMTGLATTALAQDAPGVDEEVRLDTVMIGATRRQDATVQNVPIALNAFETELLEAAGVATVADIEQIAPSVQINQTESLSTGVTLNIRGIGTASNNPGFESAVGVYIDGVYRSRPGIALGELTELERVEVLRGPQGTLFGKNTSAGAIVVETQKPEFEQRGFVSAYVGDYDAYTLQGMLTGAVSENIALRIDGKYRKRDGYLEDINGGDDLNSIDRWILEGQALYDDGVTSLRFIADYAETDELCCGAVIASLGSTAPAFAAVGAATGVNPFATPIDPATFTPGEIGTDSLRVATTPGREPLEQVTEWGFSGEYNRTFEAGAFTSITAYRDWEARRGQDVDFTGVDRAYREGYEAGIKTFTHEMRLQNTYGRLDWLVGFFYADEELNLTDTVRTGADSALYVDSLIFGATNAQVFGTLGPMVPFFGVPGAYTYDFSSPQLIVGDGQGTQADMYAVDTTTLALFTHNEYEFTDDLTLTFGLRLNTETKDLNANLNAMLPSCSALFNDPVAFGTTQALGANLQTAGIVSLLCPQPGTPEFNGRYTSSRDEDEFSGTIKLAYNVNSNFRVYGSFARGYKAGGFTLDRTAFDSVFFAQAYDPATGLGITDAAGNVI